MLNQTLTGSEQIALVEKTEVFEAHPQVSVERLESCKFAVLDNEKIVSGPFGRLVRVATDAYAKTYPSKEALLKDLEFFRKLQNEVKGDAKLQAPEAILGYFSFDGNEWHLLISFQYAMIGETDVTKYLGGIVNPEKYFNKETTSVREGVTQDVDAMLNANLHAFSNPIVVEKIGDLFYDSLAEFLSSAAIAVSDESVKSRLSNAAAHISTAWDICLPYMNGKTNPKHSREISELGMDIVDAGGMLGRLKSEQLSAFLLELSKKIGLDSQADAGRGRLKLATELHAASLALYEAVRVIV